MTANSPTKMGLIASLVISLAVAPSALAQTQDDQDHTAHHPGGAQVTQPASPGASQTAPATAAPPVVGTAPPQGMPMPGAGAPGGPPGSTPGMMGGDMQPMMMQMMRRMMAGQGAIGGSGPTRPFQRVEGELAYFRAELRITDAQVPQWNTLAEAIRGAVGQLRRAFGEATPASQRPVPAIAQLERRIALLSVQLDTARVVAAAAGPLYAALSDEQKLMADELMAEHLSLVPRMGM